MRIERSGAFPTMSPYLLTQLPLIDVDCCASQFGRAESAGLFDLPVADPTARAVGTLALCPPYRAGKDPCHAGSSATDLTIANTPAPGASESWSTARRVIRA